MIQSLQGPPMGAGSHGIAVAVAVRFEAAKGGRRPAGLHACGRAMLATVFDPGKSQHDDHVKEVHHRVDH